MQFELREITAADEKAAICDAILHGLPHWFGIEESIQGYIRDCREMPFWAVYDASAAVGFLALKPHNPHTAELAVMGIRPEYHRSGLGRILVTQAKAYCREKGFRFLTVKTLDESREDEGYAKTRCFYLAMGFYPLEVFPTLWDDANPCLLMATYLK
ncbi:GNAT family N-acetyltransferase [Ruminococcaceae bacterium OttesenSCG-928-L11]|nr:GNAT family N-acetyltransferase [Ruminococcaceae bacterium OttesenSCG-928-L11]